MKPKKIILFDGVCNLCCSWVLFLIRKDKKEEFTFVSLQSVIANRLLKSFGFIAKNTETVIYIQNNKCLQKSSAVLEILIDLGGYWRILGIFKLIPKVIRDWFYMLIAGTRYKVFGKRENCMIPSAKIQKRFLT